MIPSYRFCFLQPEVQRVCSRLAAWRVGCDEGVLLGAEIGTGTKRSLSPWPWLLLLGKQPLWHLGGSCPACCEGAEEAAVKANPYFTSPKHLLHFAIVESHPMPLTDPSPRALHGGRLPPRRGSSQQAPLGAPVLLWVLTALCPPTWTGTETKPQARGQHLCLPRPTHLSGAGGEQLPPGRDQRERT